MLPIIGFPDVVGEFAGFFRRVFSWNQFRRFKQYQSHPWKSFSENLHRT